MPDDAEGLAICIDAAYAPARARGVSLPPVSEGLDSEIHQHLVWVADDGEIRGGLVARIDGKRAQLINIAVDPARAGQGIGKRLIETALDTVRELGARRIDLVTHVDMPENISLYRHLGWQETGRDGSKVTMSRDLG